MIEWAILCRDFDDMHAVFDDILRTFPKKNRQVRESTPTKYTIELGSGKGLNRCLGACTDEPVRIYIMTKTYYERMFKYGYHGKFISSKTLRKYL